MRRAAQRRAERVAQYGRELEERVAGILEEMVDEGLLLRFTHHPPHSPADHNGRDFTVVCMVDGQEEERSFGVTISSRSWNRSKGRYPDIPQWWLPHETRDDTIRDKVLGLFEETEDAAAS